MPKYTAADVREKRISFRGLTEEQFLALQAHFHNLYPEEGYMGYRSPRKHQYARFYKDEEGETVIGNYCTSYIVAEEDIKSNLEITYDEFEFGQQEVDSWIPWNGGECPVPAGTLVDVKHRDGGEYTSLKARKNGYASSLHWNNDGMTGDIIAYRICPTVEPPFDFEAALAENNEKIGKEFNEQFWKDVGKDVVEKLTTKSALLEAEELINGERAKDYGKVSDNFSNIAIGWNVIAKDGIDARKVGHMMAWLKICRDLQNPKHDNIVDAAGYMGCIDKMTREQ